MLTRSSPRRFFRRSMTFNGKLIPRPRLVVSPLDAEDVSTIIKFCTQHGLSPSVRAGGYAIAGWAVAGDIVIDLEVEACPKTCENFLKLCKVYYYNLNAFFNGESSLHLP